MSSPSIAERRVTGALLATVLLVAFAAPPAVAQSGGVAADYTMDPSPPFVSGEEVTFDASDSQGDIASYEWTFGFTDRPDVTKTGEVITHTFEKGGAFHLTLTVTGESGATDSFTILYRVIQDAEGENSPPTASFEAPSRVLVGSTITFDAADYTEPTASRDSDGVIRGYEWDFDGDGETDATGGTATYTFEETGDHTIALTVTDDDGATNTTTRTIEVVEEANARPVADYTLDPSPPFVSGHEVTFDASDSYDSDGEIVSYEWFFSFATREDVKKTGEVITHSFEKGGAVHLTLKVTDDDGATDSFTILYRVIQDAEGENSPPTATFTSRPAEPLPGEEVTFDASDSRDSDGLVRGYEWDFDGDGETDATGGTATYTFEETGDHDVTLTVTDDDGDANTTTRTVEVVEERNAGPTVDYTVDPSPPFATGEEVTFDASDSYDSDGDVVSYEWTFDFHDQPDVRKTGRVVTHTFEENEPFFLTLRVTDDDGASNSFTTLYRVFPRDENQHPTAWFLTSPRTPAAGEEVAFDAAPTTDDGTVTAYEWDFDGDGETDATGETATHAFEETGDHDVTLTVTDDDGATDTVTRTVAVGGEGDSESTVVYRVNGGDAVVESADDGPDWASADDHPALSGGSQAATDRRVATAASVPATTPAAVFQSEWYGDSDWAFPVESGQTYLVRVYFAEIDAGDVTAAGQRVFDVRVEGETVLDGYDVYADAGADVGVAKSFTVTPDDDVLEVSLRGVEGRAKVSAVEVVRVGEE